MLKKLSLCAAFAWVLPLHAKTLLIANKGSESVSLVCTLAGTLQIVDVAKREIVNTFKSSNHFEVCSGSYGGGALGLLPLPITVLVQKEEGKDIAYVANAFAGYIARINLQNGEHLEAISIDGESEPDGMAVSSVDVSL